MHLDTLLSANGARKKLVYAILATFALIVLCFIVLIIAQAVGNGEEPGGKLPTGDIAYTQLPISSEDVFSRGSLLLVNATHGMKVYPKDADLLTVYGQNKTDSYKVKTSSMRLRPEALTAFNQMLDAYFASSQDNTVNITSAYRTDKEQAALNSATKAGHSDHHTALSVALNCVSTTTAELPLTHWLYTNAHHYGFIQRFPESKTASTGVSDYENCFRYVGVAHATYMYENGLSLEEYIDLLRQYPHGGSHLTVTAGSSTYEIYYVPASTPAAPGDASTEAEGTTAESTAETAASDEPTVAITSIPVPKDLPYEISGNNVDGFIVTVKRS